MPTLTKTKWCSNQKNKLITFYKLILSKIWQALTEQVLLILAKEIILELIKDCMKDQETTKSMCKTKK